MGEGTSAENNGRIRVAIVRIVLFCFASLFLINYLVTHFPMLHFGKDHGMVMMIILTCIASAILFFFIESSFLKYFFGLIIGVLSFAAVYVLYAIFNQGNKADLPLIVDNSIAFTLIALFAISRYRKNKASIK